MKTFFWYTLKIWFIAALPPSIFIFYMSAAMTNATATQAMGVFPKIFLYTAPSAIFAGFCVARLFPAGMGVYQRKALVWLCAVMGLVPMTVLMQQDSEIILIMLLLYLFLTGGILLVKTPAAPPLFQQLPLRGRHVTLKPDNEMNPWRGMVVSGVHALPIRLKLDRNSPYPQLEIHSLENEDIFHLIADYVPVRVHACLPGKNEPLFSGVLEIDHSLN